jgi:hypothetical protein
MLAGFFILATGLQAAPGTPTGLEVVHDPITNNLHLNWDAPAIPPGGEAAHYYRVRKKTYKGHEPAWSAAVYTTTWPDPAPESDPYSSAEYEVRAYNLSHQGSSDVARAYYARQRFDFVLPWDVNMAVNATPNFSNRNTAITGTLRGDDLHRIFKDAEGNFRRGSVSGPKIRFVGVNLSNAACFPPVNNINAPTDGEAVAIARRMAQLGINLVRFHQIDKAQPFGVFTDDTLQSLDAGQMTRLAFFVKQLKANGIYVDMNLRVLMKYPNPNGGEAMLFKGADIFSEDRLWQPQKTYAQLLLNWPNASYVSGVGKYSEDPAVALIEISNEDGLIREWVDGRIDELETLSSTLYDELTTHWNDWLTAKYANDSVLSSKWAPAKALVTPYGTEALDDETRSQSTLGALSGLWWKENPPTQNVVAWVSGSSVNAPSGNAIKIDIKTATPSQHWYDQVFCGPLALNPDLTYTLRFKGRSDVDRDFSVVYRTYNNTPYGKAAFRLTNEWQDFTMVVPPGQTGLHLVFTGFAKTAGISYLSGFSLTVGDALKGPAAFLPESVDITSTNCLNNSADAYNVPAFQTMPAGWQFESSPTPAAAACVTHGRSTDVNSFKVTRTGAGTINLLRPLPEAPTTHLPLRYRRTYQLSFEVKASQAVDFTAHAKMTAGSWTTYGTTTLVASAAWTTKTLVFTVNDDFTTTTPEVPSRIGFGLGNLAQSHSLEFANIAVRELPPNVLNPSVDAHLPFLFSSATFPHTINGATWSLINNYTSTAPTTAIVSNGRKSTAPTVSSLKITAPGVITSTEDGPGTLIMKLELANGGTYLQRDKSYYLTFDVKTSSATPFDIVTVAQMQGTPYPVFSSSTQQVSNVWSTRSLGFVINEDNNHNTTAVPMQFYIQLGNLPAHQTLEFSNLSIREGAMQGMPQNGTLQPTLLSQRIRPVRRSEFRDYTRQVQTDWIKFLWDRELTYWTHMRDHVKKPLNQGGLIEARALTIGTQGEYSPNLLQDAAGFDVIDAHGYWCHTVNNEYIENKSMMAVSDADIASTTIPRRAGARIIGKPYLLSEYNQPGPSTYGSETFPLIGAYAAHQGWAGVVAFDYERRYLPANSSTVTWDPGKEGMFNMGQAPAKMMTLPALRVMLGQAGKSGSPAPYSQPGVATTYAGRIDNTAFAVVHDDVTIEMIRQRLAVDINTVDFGIDSRFAYVMPVGLKRPEPGQTSHRAMPDVVPASPYVAATTGDVSWDSTNKRVLVKGQMNKAALGNLPTAGSVNLDDGVTITSTSPKLQGTNSNYANFVLTRKDDFPAKTFGENGTRWLLTTGGYSDNHFVKWQSNRGPTNGRTAVSEWGVTPTLLERIGGTLTFTLPSGCYLHARALNQYGVPFETLTVSDPGSGSSRTVTVTLPTYTLTPWYEMYVTTSPTP